MQVWLRPPRVLVVVGVGGLGAAGLVAIGLSRVAVPTAAALTQDDAVSIAMATAEHVDVGPGMPRTGWKPTFVEKEAGREFVLHFPGNHLVQRAPCMRLFDSSQFPCSKAPIWYVQLETPDHLAYVAVVVDSGLRTGRIVQSGSGGMKALPPGITPFPSPAVKRP